MSDGGAIVTHGYWALEIGLVSAGIWGIYKMHTGSLSRKRCKKYPLITLKEWLHVEMIIEILREVNY